jgi:hypothetical protein
MPPLHPGDTFPQLTLNIPGVQAIRASGLVGIRVAALLVDDEQEVGSVHEAIGARAFDSAAAPALGPEERGAACSSSRFWSRPACPPGSLTPSMTHAGTANSGRKPTRRSL